MTEETTTEQLAEIEGQGEVTPATEYTPPEGGRVLAVGERLRDGDVSVRRDGYEYPTERVGGWVGSNQRYIRPIESQSQPEPESDTELQAQVAFLKGREVTLGTRLQQEREVTTRLRGEMETVQNQLGESRQRVTELEELVGSLRTINRGCENAVRDAGKENFALKNQLAAVKAELASVAADRQRLQIELDAAQQVPADSPELRQLRADLAEVAHDRDTYKHAHELLVQDIDATHQRTKAMTVEAIVEWLEPIRTCGSQALATAVVSNLPHIMRTLTGLNDEEIE